MYQFNRFLTSFGRDFGRKKIGTYAAAGTFYMFLSLPSIILIVVSVLPYTNLTAELMERVLQELFPDSMYSVIESVVQTIYVASGARLSLSIVLTCWTASLSMAALMRGLRVCYDVGKRENYLVLRVKALFYMVLLLGTGFITLGVIVFGRQIFYIAIERFGLSEGFWALGGLLSYWRYAVIFVLMVGIFSLIYRFGSGTKMSLRHHFIGAVFSAVCWLAFSAMFSAYVARSGYSVYGILGTVLVSMLWVYYCVFLLLMGGQLNRYIFLVKNGSV